MLYLWYQNAILFWYRFFNLFTDNIKARIRMKKRSSAAGGNANADGNDTIARPRLVLTYIKKIRTND